MIYSNAFDSTLKTFHKLSQVHFKQEWSLPEFLFTQNTFFFLLIDILFKFQKQILTIKHNLNDLYYCTAKLENHTKQLIVIVFVKDQQWKSDIFHTTKEKLFPANAHGIFTVFKLTATRLPSMKNKCNFKKKKDII